MNITESAHRVQKVLDSNKEGTTNLSLKDIKTVITTYFDILEDFLINGGESANLTRSLGTFIVKSRKSHTRPNTLNVTSKKQFKVPARKVVHFKPSIALKTKLKEAC